MTAPRIRAAGTDDAEVVALLHADSWRRHLRGAYADSFLDGDVIADRCVVWSFRLAAPGNSLTVLAEDGAGPVGFAHVVFDHDERWGSLVDNLHVAHDRRRTGIGTALLTRAAEAVIELATASSVYLWVLEQNADAQRFYGALGVVPAWRGRRCHRQAGYPVGSTAPRPGPGSSGPTPRRSVALSSPQWTDAGVGQGPYRRAAPCPGSGRRGCSSIRRTAASIMTL
jgi:GNAT superfamily N-acetyltransferase